MQIIKYVRPRRGDRVPCLALAFALAASVDARGADYTWNANFGAWHERSNWVETGNWNPMAPEDGPSELDKITVIDGSINLSLGGQNRSVAEIYRRGIRGKWYMSGDGTGPVAFQVGQVTNLCSGDLIFQNGGGAKAGLSVSLGDLEVAAGSVYFGAKSKTPARALAGVVVRGQTRISGKATVYLNVPDGADAASLGLLIINEGGVTLNIGQDEKERQVSVAGIEGDAGHVQAGADGHTGGDATLHIAGAGNHNTAVEFRDGPEGAKSARLSIVKRGGGSQVFSAKNTYGGTTLVEGGSLIVNGAHSGGGSYRIKSGATLAGSGAIQAAGMVFEKGARLAPGGGGAATGTLTLSITDALDLSLLEGGGELDFDVSNTGSCDKVSLISGRLNIGKLSFDDFTFRSAGRPRSGRYVLIDATAPVLGEVTTAQGEINGARARVFIDTTNHDVVLIIH